MAKKTEIPMYIYSNKKGLMARIVSEAEYKKAAKIPGTKVTRWEPRDEFPFVIVVVHHGWLASDDIRYLIDTQVSMWPAFQNGVALKWAKGGIGGS